MDREQIIQEASEMFFSIGFKTLTMDDIANKLAISKKTLYEHFGSKENLIAKVLVLEFEDIENFFKKIQSEHYNAVEELLELKRYVDQKYASLQRQNCMYQLQKYYAKLHRKIFLTQHHKILDQLCLNLERGKQQGIYRADIDHHLTSSLFLNTQNAIKSNQNLKNDLEYQFQMAEIHADIFIRGILSPKGLSIYEQLIKSE